MDRIDTVKVPKSLPRPAGAADVTKVLAVICSRRPRQQTPLDRLRDRVLFETAYVCGARASEVCGLYVEDLDLRLDDEHVRIHGRAAASEPSFSTTEATSPCSSSTSPAPATPPGRCAAPPPTAAAGRCPTTPPTPAGRPTARRPGSRSTSTNCATPTPPNSSTPMSPSRPCAATWATPPPKPPSSTRCWTTRSPTPRSDGILISNLYRLGGPGSVTCKINAVWGS